MGEVGLHWMQWPWKVALGMWLLRVFLQKEQEVVTGRTEEEVASVQGDGKEGWFGGRELNEGPGTQALTLGDT